MRWAPRLLSIAGLIGGTVFSSLSADSALADQRVALMVGNPDYQNAAKLSTPANDADAKGDYELASQIGTSEAWQAFLNVYKSGLYADLARAQLVKLLDAERRRAQQSSPRPQQDESRKPQQALQDDAVARPVAAAAGSAAIPVAPGAGRRVALVVGVSKYEHASALANTINDANDMAAALRRLGFDVETLLDPDRSALEAAIRRYGERSVGAETSTFYYSGHALEAGGHNWLLPVTVNVSSLRELRFEAVDLDTVIEQTDGAARISIVFLDACRDNPFAGRLAGIGRDLSSRGLARIETAAAGMLVAFSTAPGQIALDGDKRNSPFTMALLRHIETPGLEIKSLLAQVTKDVVESTKGKQRPWQNSSLEGDFYFVPPSAPPPASAAPPANNLEAIFWDSIKSSRNAAEFKAYLARFPDGVFAELARNRIAMLQQPATTKALEGSSPTAQVVPGGPPLPAPPDAAGKTSPPALHDDLAGRLALLTIASEEADARARSYESDRDHKAIAVSFKAHHTWRTSGWPSGEAAITAALESCQIYYNAPCALAASDEVLAAAPGGTPALRDMPRTHYAGAFEPGQIPAGRGDVLARQDVTSYRSALMPKAAAYHPWGRLFTVAAAASQFDAEEQALAQCNNDPGRKGADGPCFLYAAGDQVVLPQRSVKPLAQRPADPIPQQQAALGPQNAGPTAPTSPPPAGSPVQAPNPSSLHEQLLARFAALSVAAGDAQTQSRGYEAASGHKAIAVAATAHLGWKATGWASAEGAANAALEGCQVAYGAPCILLAADEKIDVTASNSTAPKDMPRSRYAGSFDPERVPAADPGLLRRADVISYPSAGAPKAAAYHPSGRLFVVAQATGQYEAEEQALAQCNDDPGRKGQDGPCFLYAAGNRVVLPQRLTKPRSRPQTISQVFDYLNVPSWSYQHKDLKAHKAIAVVPESGQTFRWGSQSSGAIAEERTLEGCQLTFAAPCVLLASDDELRAPDPWKAPRRDMPRLHNDGPYKPEAVPLFSGTENELHSYVLLSEPKAMVIRPNGGRIRTATGVSPEDAQAKALAACNDDSSTNPFPCFVYAVNDRVIIDQRRTEPLK